jgi:hypothetical protein
MTQKIDMQKAPKQFCENVTVGFNAEHFIMAMLNGGVGTVYALTPGHTKRLHQYLGHHIEAYEKKHGAIDVEDWNPNIKSPLQIEGGQ